MNIMLLQWIGRNGAVILILIIIPLLDSCTRVTTLGRKEINLSDSITNISEVQTTGGRLLQFPLYPASYSPSRREIIGIADINDSVRVEIADVASIQTSTSSELVFGLVMTGVAIGICALGFAYLVHLLGDGPR